MYFKSDPFLSTFTKFWWKFSMFLPMISIHSHNVCWFKVNKQDLSVYCWMRYARVTLIVTYGMQAFKRSRRFTKEYRRQGHSWFTLFSLTNFNHIFNASNLELGTYFINDILWIRFKITPLFLWRNNFTKWSKNVCVCKWTIIILA